MRQILLVAAALCLAGCGRAETGAADPDAADPEQETAAWDVESPDATVSVAALSDEYERNEVAADSQYTGKWLEVRGKVQKIRGGGQDGLPAVVLSGERSDPKPVRCYFERERDNLKRLARLTPGQTVSIRGRCAGLRRGVLALRNCSLPLTRRDVREKAEAKAEREAAAERERAEREAAERRALAEAAARRAAAKRAAAEAEARRAAERRAAAREAAERERQEERARQREVRKQEREDLLKEAEERTRKIAAALTNLEDSDPNVRAKAVRTLIGLGEPAVPDLVDALGTDPSVVVRRGAALALGGIASPGAVVALTEGLKDKSSAVRVAAAWSLGKTGRRASKALPVLRRLAARDDSVAVSSAARKAVENIAGR
jgi:hypothetical protein